MKPQPRNVGDWTPKKLNRLERKYRSALRLHMQNKGPNWIEIGDEQLPIHFVGYLVAHLREVFGQKTK